MGARREPHWMKVTSADLLIPGGFAIVGIVEAVVQNYEPLWLSITTFIVACGALCFRRHLPLLVAPAVACANLVAALGGVDVSEPASWLLVLPFATLAAGLHAERIAAGLASVLVLFVVVFAVLALLTDFEPDIFFGTILLLGSWGIGLSLRRAFERNQALGMEIEHARMEHQAAAAAERNRIARELHDLLAHSLSVTVVQASLAEDLLRSDPEAALAALREVQASGRSALAETSEVLRLIREGDADPIAPRHSTDDIPTLVDEFSRAGLDVTLDLDPEVRSLPPGVGPSLYRIAQEGLTNALKHAHGAQAAVRIDRLEDCVAIEIQTGPGQQRSELTRSGRHGLTGVRERVALFGGTFHAGPSADGGFVVTARLPIANGTMR